MFYFKNSEVFKINSLIKNQCQSENVAVAAWVRGFSTSFSLQGKNNTFGAFLIACPSLLELKCWTLSLHYSYLPQAKFYNARPCTERLFEIACKFPIFS